MDPVVCQATRSVEESGFGASVLGNPFAELIESFSNEAGGDIAVAFGLHPLLNEPLVVTGEGHGHANGHAIGVRPPRRDTGCLCLGFSLLCHALC